MKIKDVERFMWWLGRGLENRKYHSLSSIKKKNKSSSYSNRLTKLKTDPGSARNSHCTSMPPLLHELMSACRRPMLRSTMVTVLTLTLYLLGNACLPNGSRRGVTARLKKLFLCSSTKAPSISTQSKSSFNTSLQYLSSNSSVYISVLSILLWKRSALDLLNVNF